MNPYDTNYRSIRLARTLRAAGIGIAVLVAVMWLTEKWLIGPAGPNSPTWLLFGTLTIAGVLIMASTTFLIATHRVQSRAGRES